jgi:predicted aspartyl protease
MKLRGTTRRAASQALSLAAGGTLLCAAVSHGAAVAPAAAVPAASDQLAEIVIEAPEPRFVSPTQRDKIGRIWAPVMIDGKGPFRLVLDTGASRSSITAEVADRLGIPPDQSRPVLLRGVTGSVAVPTIRVDAFAVGDVILTPVTLPIIADALGGAEGVLGTEGFGDKRIFIDFKRDVITIVRSHGDRAPPGFVVVPVQRSSASLLMIHALVGGVRVQAIIDTGAQTTIGNEAMRIALVRRHAQGTQNQIVDVTAEVQNGESFASPPIEIGSIRIRSGRITFSDMHIFEHWHLTKEPALLIGMDALGLLGVFIIDYRRHEIQLHTRNDG